MGRIFGTDGVRGVANKDLTTELATDIGRAAAMVVEERIHRRPVFLIGKDTRISSDMLEHALASGLCSAGADVVLLGTVPTPAVAFLVTKLGADAGIMLSASHNPFEYNGIKIFGSKGFKLTDEEEEEIEEIVLDHAKPYEIKSGDKIGRVTMNPFALEDYIEHLKNTADTELSGIKALIDCSNGSASATAKQLFKRLKVDYTLICDTPNGVNINAGCGSTHIEALAKKVKEGGFDIGIAFDGDADRCLAVDADGEIVDGDKLMAIFAKDMLQRGILKNSCAVVTVMSNLGFFKFCKENNIKAVSTKVGDRYVLGNMLMNGHNIGGEQSGHIIFLDYMTTGDGQLSAVQLLTVMKKTGKSLKELASVMTRYPQVMLSVAADKEAKKKLEEDDVIAATISECEADLNGDGRILVRASGTEPIIRVMVEGADEAVIDEVARRIARVIEERIKR